MERRTASTARRALMAKHAKGPVDQYSARLARIDAVRRREIQRARDWCILRTNGRRTLALVASLQAAGIEAWSPRETLRKRLPRGKKGTREVEVAIVPSFVFVRACFLPDLLIALSLPSNPHPAFSIFQHAGRAPAVSDREMAHLHEVEDRRRLARLKTQRHVVPIGMAVTPRGGAFAGLHGVVEEVSGGQASVCFNGNFRVKIASWLILGDDVDHAAAHGGTAAQAA